MSSRALRRALPISVGVWLVAAAHAIGCGADVVEPAVAAGTTSGTGGGSTTSSGVGGDSGTVCTPGATTTCYSGPAGTEGVGICAAGVRTCAMDGSGFGPCEGEITPQPEDCATAANEDCSGSNAACGSLGWAGRFGGEDAQLGVAIAVDTAGGVVVTGLFQGKLDFGVDPLFAGNGYEIFVARFAPGGQPLWSRQFSNENAYDKPPSVALDPEGNVLLAGAATTAIDFGGGPRCAPGFDQTYLVKLDPAGNHLWSRCFGEATESTGNHAMVAADPTGDVVLAATSYGPIDFGGGPLSSGSVVIGKYDASGNALWTEALGGAGATAIPFGLAVDPTGHVIVGGVFDMDVDFGTGPFQCSKGSCGFVLELDPSGAPLWSRSFAGSGAPRVSGIAADAGARVVVTSGGIDTIDFGGGQVVNPSPAPSLASFDPAGNLLWTAAPAALPSGAVACGPNGDVFALLEVSGGMGDGGPWPPSTIALTRFDATGSLLATHAFGAGAGAAMAAQGPWLALTGDAQGPIDFGGGALTGTGDEDVFIAVLAP